MHLHTHVQKIVCKIFHAHVGHAVPFKIVVDFYHNYVVVKFVNRQTIMFQAPRLCYLKQYGSEMYGSQLCL